MPKGDQEKSECGINGSAVYINKEAKKLNIDNVQHSFTFPEKGTLLMTERPS